MSHPLYDDGRWVVTWGATGMYDLPPPPLLYPILSFDCCVDREDVMRTKTRINKIAV